MDVRKLFDTKEVTRKEYYYELIVIYEKIYFMYAICYMMLAKELKLTNRKIKEREIVRSHRSSEIFLNQFMKKSGRERVRGSILNTRPRISSRSEKEIKENIYTIRKFYSKAIKYFKMSNEVNRRYSINRIKTIVILIYICKCNLKLEEKKEAIESIKQALIAFYDLNKDWIEMNNRHKLNSRIVMIINSAVMEQILYYIGLINKGIQPKLSTLAFINTLSASYFKTDTIQAKCCKHLYSLLKSENKKYSFLEKMNIRLIKNNDYNKNLFIFFSNELVKVLPTKIELCEIIQKCIKNYMNKDDDVVCSRFDNYYTAQRKKASEFSKEQLIKILNESFDSNVTMYEMEEVLSFVLSKIKEDNDNKESKDSKKKERDNYVFLFILAEDYRFSSKEKNHKKRDQLIKNKVSVYAFVFDPQEFEKKDKVQIDKQKKRSKKGKIIHHLRQLPEGILVEVYNFSSIKSVFQNISGNYSPKNVFNINYNTFKNMYFDYDY